MQVVTSNVKYQNYSFFFKWPVKEITSTTGHLHLNYAAKNTPFRTGLLVLVRTVIIFLYYK